MRLDGNIKLRNSSVFSENHDDAKEVRSCPGIRCHLPRSAASPHLYVQQEDMHSRGRSTRAAFLPVGKVAPESPGASAGWAQQSASRPIGD